jgi:hypothetical protein
MNQVTLTHILFGWNEREQGTALIGHRSDHYSAYLLKDTSELFWLATRASIYLAVLLVEETSELFWLSIKKITIACNPIGGKDTKELLCMVVPSVNSTASYWLKEKLKNPFPLAIQVTISRVLIGWKRQKAADPVGLPGDQYAGRALPSWLLIVLRLIRGHLSEYRESETKVDYHPFSPHEAVPRQNASPVIISDIVSLKEHPRKQTAIVILGGNVSLCCYRRCPMSCANTQNKESTSVEAEGPRS